MQLWAVGTWASSFKTWIQGKKARSVKDDCFAGILGKSPFLLNLFKLIIVGKSTGMEKGLYGVLGWMKEAATATPTMSQ